jgi:hypothetical protein
MSATLCGPFPLTGADVVAWEQAVKDAIPEAYTKEDSFRVNVRIGVIVSEANLNAKPNFAQHIRASYQEQPNVNISRNSGGTTTRFSLFGTKLIETAANSSDAEDLATRIIRTGNPASQGRVNTIWNALTGAGQEKGVIVVFYSWNDVRRSDLVTDVVYSTGVTVLNGVGVRPVVAGEQEYAQ